TAVAATELTDVVLTPAPFLRRLVEHARHRAAGNDFDCREREPHALRLREDLVERRAIADRVAEVLAPAVHVGALDAARVHCTDRQLREPVTACRLRR